MAFRLRIPEVNYLVNQTSPIDVYNNRFGIINKDFRSHHIDAINEDEAAAMGFAIAAPQDEVPIDNGDDGTDLLSTKDSGFVRGWDK